ncbi:MAG: ABC transporter permease, partial [Gemmatimonadaceae bacterium]
MQFLESIRLAVAQIRVQKLKSFFTLLGVMISVTFLIAVVSIVQGMSVYVEQDFAGKFLGINTFNLRPYPDIQTGNVTDEQWKEWQRRPKITVADAMAVKAALPADSRWAMQDVRWMDVSSEYANGGAQVLAEAATPQLFRIKDLQVVQGREYNDQEEALGTDVIVIGDALATQYFPNLDPIGQTLKVGRFPFRVIGVLAHQGTVFGLNLDRQAIAPFHSQMSTLTGARQSLYGVVVQSPTPAAFQPLEEEVREVMRRRHQLHPAQPDNFVMESSASALSQWATIKKYLVLAGIALPAIGLVVGAIVIMNIMLVAVAERTREIGIRKSLGARRRDILSQFLVESATLSALGAIMGVALGIALAKLVAALSPLPAAVAPWSIVVAVSVGAG